MLHPLSLTSLHLELLDHKGDKFGDASGFLLNRNGKLYLCTNKHVLLGSFNLNLEAPNKDSPHSLQIWFYYKSANGVEWQKKVVPLHDGCGNKNWHCHPTINNYDIALLEVDFDYNHLYQPVTLDHQTFSKFVLPGTMVHIIGFPFGLVNGPNAPIWKTGYVAADTSIHWENEPVFLVDCETSFGMSGSPVFKAPKGEYDPEKHFSLEFIGVYSGRVKKVVYKFRNEEDGYEEKELYPRLAKVWNPLSIEEIFLNNRL